MRRARCLLTVAIAALAIAALLAACSSGDDGDPPEDTGPASAAADTDAGGDQTGGESAAAAPAQTFEMTLEVTSPVFSRIRRIPKAHVCPGRPPKPGTAFEQDALTRYDDRKNTSPPLDWTGLPEGTQSIALMMDSDQLAHDEDPDARWTHWLIWNLPADTAGLAEAVATTTEVAALGPDARQGTNDDGVIGYSGPCPLPVTVGYREARPKIVFEYLFHVYALDTVLDLPGGATRAEFLNAIEGHVLAGGVIMGEFVASKQMLEF